MNALSAKLNYPGEGVPALASTREIALKDNQALDCTKMDYEKRLLFKEAVSGSAMRKVEISAIEKASKIDKVILQALGAGAVAAAAAIPAARDDSHSHSHEWG